MSSEGGKKKKSGTKKKSTSGASSSDASSGSGKKKRKKSSALEAPDTSKSTASSARKKSTAEIIQTASAEVSVSGLDDIISSDQRQHIYYQRIRDLATKYKKRGKFNDDYIKMQLNNAKGTEHKVYLKLFEKIVPSDVRSINDEPILPSFGHDIDGGSESTLKHLKAVRARMEKRMSTSLFSGGKLLDQSEIDAAKKSRKKKTAKKTKSADIGASRKVKAKRKAPKKIESSEEPKGSLALLSSTAAATGKGLPDSEVGGKNIITDEEDYQEIDFDKLPKKPRKSTGKKRKSKSGSSGAVGGSDVLSKLADLMNDAGSETESSKHKTAGLRGRRGSKAEDMLESAIKSATESITASDYQPLDDSGETTSVKVCCRFRPLNIMEKRHEVKLQFITEFDMDDKDFTKFIKVRHELLELDRKMHAEGKAKLSRQARRKARKKADPVSDDEDSNEDYTEDEEDEESDISDMSGDEASSDGKKAKKKVKKTWKPVIDWTVQECCKWLEKNELDDYKKRFRRRQVNGAWLMDIPEWSEKKPLEIEDKRVIAFKRGDQSHCYDMDVVLNTRVTQEETFARLGLPVVDSLIGGYNCTIFAYGQTGTGKTHTMFGPSPSDKSTCEFNSDDVYLQLLEEAAAKAKKAEEEAAAAAAASSGRSKSVDPYDDDDDLMDDDEYQIRIGSPYNDEQTVKDEVASMLTEVIIDEDDDMEDEKSESSVIKKKPPKFTSSDSSDSLSDLEDEDEIDRSAKGRLRLKKAVDKHATDVVSKKDRKKMLKVKNGGGSSSRPGSRKGSQSRFVLNEKAGLIPRVLLHLFERLKNDSEVVYYNVQMAFIEIYNEQLRDLIKPRLKLTLRYIGRDSNIDNLSWWDVNSVNEALTMIAKSKQNRQTASTKQNLTSSRSHCIIQCQIEMTLNTGKQQMVKLNLCDLAGSEKVTKTGAASMRLTEAKKIVQSLFALKKVIRALAEKKAFVPYQDSVLTKLLRDSLGGNSKTTMLICCSPHAYNREETVSTLQFAEIARKIQNEAVVNRLLSREEMEAQLKQFQTQLQYLRKQKSMKSRFTSTDFRVLHAQLSETAKKAEEFQTLYLQSEIQLLVKTQYVHELEQVLSQKNKELVKVYDEINARKKQSEKLKIKVKRLKEKIVELESGPQSGGE